MQDVDAFALAARFGAACAVRHSGGEISYVELAKRVAERKTAFASRGVTDRAALVCSSDPDTLVSALVLLDLGCMVVPVSAEMPGPELAGLASQCGISWIVSGSKATATGHANVNDNRGAILALLSSGSTGKPKLVLRSEPQIHAAMEIYARSVELSAADRVIAVVPLEHAYGFTNVFLASLSRGAAIVFPRTNHPRAVADAVRRERITIFPGAPLFFDLMTKFARSSDGGLGIVRCCISVGTALATRINDAFLAAFNIPIWQSYGASEAGPVCLNKTGAPDGEVLALGAPCDGADVEIRNGEGHVASEGDEGEIVIRSPAVGIGYEGEHDGASRIEPGVFYTGDIGCLREGVLYFRGRRKLLVSTAGNKVDPQEVENVLLRHPKIEDAAVVAHREPDSREIVKALVVLREPATALEITDYCSGHIASFKVPRIIEFRDSLPRNAMGKLQRENL